MPSDVYDHIFGRCKVLVTLIDNFLRKVWLYALKSKGEWFERFKGVKAPLEIQSEHKVEAFWSNNRGKFLRHLSDF